MKQPSEKEQLEARLYFLDKQYSHVADAFGFAKTSHYREIAKKEFDRLVQEISELREQIKSFASK